MTEKIFLFTYILVILVDMKRFYSINGKNTTNNTHGLLEEFIFEKKPKKIGFLLFKSYQRQLINILIFLNLTKNTNKFVLKKCFCIFFKNY